jgi:alkylation response protein AidB-like acyl-CoA dehydrogenase
MQLQLSAEDAAFREEMRTFFTTEFPQEIRDTVLEGRHLTREQIVESQRVLNQAGLAVPHWPQEWGGRGWSDLQRHLWHEEMQRAGVPTPLAFNASMIGPVLAQFGTQ